MVTALAPMSCHRMPEQRDTDDPHDGLRHKYHSRLAGGHGLPLLQEDGQEGEHGGQAGEHSLENHQRDDKRPVREEPQIQQRIGDPQLDRDERDEGIRPDGEQGQDRVAGPAPLRAFDRANRMATHPAEMHTNPG